MNPSAKTRRRKVSLCHHAYILILSTTQIIILFGPFTTSRSETGAEITHATTHKQYWKSRVAGRDGTRDRTSSQLVFVSRRY